MTIRLLSVSIFLFLTTSFDPSYACIIGDTCPSEIEACASPNFRSDEHVVVVSGASGGTQWTDLEVRLPLPAQQASPKEKLRWEFERQGGPENQLDAVATNLIELDNSLQAITLVLLHNRPSVFRLIGNTDTVERVILVGSIYNEINYVGVTGVAEGKVEFLQGDLSPLRFTSDFQRKCPLLQFLEPKGYALISEKIQAFQYDKSLVDRHQNTSWFAYGGLATELRLYVDQGEINAEMLNPLDNQIDADLSTYEERQAYRRSQTERDLYRLRGYLPGTTSIPQETIHSLMTFLPNSLPPFWHGLDLLREEGVLIVREDGDVFKAKLDELKRRATDNSIKNLEEVDAILLKPTTRLPRYLTSLEYSSSNFVNGSYDKKYRVLVLGDNDPPLLDPRDRNACLVFENDKKKKARSCE